MLQSVFLVALAHSVVSVDFNIRTQWNILEYSGRFFCSSFPSILIKNEPPSSRFRPVSHVNIHIYLYMMTGHGLSWTTNTTLPFALTFCSTHHMRRGRFTVTAKGNPPKKLFPAFYFYDFFLEVHVSVPQ